MDYPKLLLELQCRIGYQFSSLVLLETALTHKSFANEQLRDPTSCNERQEFLGDAVLDLIMAEFLFQHYPHLPEGELSRIRSEMVSATALAQVGRRLDIGACLRLGRGELRSGGRAKDNLLADTVEAVFGAIFLDAGWDTTRNVLVPLFEPGIIEVVGRKSQDYKTRLQEIVQARHGQVPDYDLVEVSGPDHQRQYTIIVRCDGIVLGEGSGSSKKIAQQHAARVALNEFEPEE